MGYRLEIPKLEYTGDCGGKLFGYISDEQLHDCKSWQWLKEHRYLDEETEDIWNYGIDHGVCLFGPYYEEFIKLYIEDYNKYSPYGNKLSLDDFEQTLNLAKKYESLYIEWC